MEREAKRPRTAPERSTASAKIKGNDLSIGRPKYRPPPATFTTRGGVVKILRSVEGVALSRIDEEIETLVQSLDERRGCIFESAYEYPGRYARWTMGFVNPPLVLVASGRNVSIKALNARGSLLLGVLHEHLSKKDNVESSSATRFLEGAQYDSIAGVGMYTVCASETRFAEEERSKQPSSFSVIRAVIDFFFSSEDPQIGLYGAFGYDLTFQFEKIKLKHVRPKDSRDVVLYLPDELLVYDKPAREAWRLKYDFEIPETGSTTISMPRIGATAPFKGQAYVAARRDHAQVSTPSLSRKLGMSSGWATSSSLFFRRRFMNPVLIPRLRYFTVSANAIPRPTCMC